MACSKAGYGKCSRCGTVGEMHFADGRAENSEEQERVALKHAFFSQKKKFPTSAQQLRMRLYA